MLRHEPQRALAVQNSQLAVRTHAAHDQLEPHATHVPAYTLTRGELAVSSVVTATTRVSAARFAP